MSKNITIKDLLAKKEQFKNKKRTRETYFIESLGGNITIEEPTREFCIEALEMAQESPEKADVHNVYHCIVDPNLKDPELQKGLGCVEPTDIVDMLFKAGEIASISGHCLLIAGYGNGLKKVSSDLKN